MPPFYVSSFPGQPLDAIVNQIVNILQGATGTLWIDQYVVLGTGAADPPVVIPATVDVRVPIGGWVELGEGTLAIEGPFTAPPVQVFSWAGWLPRPPRQGNPPGPHPKPGHPTFFLNRPSGRVVWGPAVVPSIRPEWYGAWPDGVLDSKFAIQQAIDDAHSSWKKNYFQQTVHLSAGTYVVGSAGTYSAGFLNYPQDKYVVPPGDVPEKNWNCVLCSRPWVNIEGASQIETIVKVGDNVRDGLPGHEGVTHHDVFVLFNNTEALHNCTFRGFTVDYNAANNLIPDFDACCPQCGSLDPGHPRCQCGGTTNTGCNFVASTTIDPQSQTICNEAYAMNQSGLGAWACIGCTFDHLTFLNANGSHCIRIGGKPTPWPTSEPLGGDTGGTPTQNLGQISSGCRITNCTFHNVGHSIAGNFIRDHSSIYCAGWNSTIQGNFFYNDYYPGQLTAGTTAIEVHAPNSEVLQNFVINYGTGVNLAIDHGDGLLPVCFNVKVHDNSFYVVYQAIVFWALDDDVPHALQDVYFQDNWIYVRPSDHPAIDHVSNITNVAGGYTNGLYITGNQLYAYTSPPTAGSSSPLNCPPLNSIICPPLDPVICPPEGATTVGDVKFMVGIWVENAVNICISRNQIYDFLNEGIWIEEDDNDTKPPQPPPMGILWAEVLTGLEVAFNLLVNTGGSRKRAVVLITGSSRKITKAFVHDNQVDNAVADAMGQMIWGLHTNLTMGKDPSFSDTCFSKNNFDPPNFGYEPLSVPHSLQPPSCTPLARNSRSPCNGGDFSLPPPSFQPPLPTWDFWPGPPADTQSGIASVPPDVSFTNVMNSLIVAPRQ